MNLYPYNPNLGQKVQSNVKDHIIDRSFVAHLEFSTPETQSITGVIGATALTDSIQTISANITNPDIPRNLKIKGNTEGITGDVVITGTNIADEVITETLALNGDTEVLGNKAFKTVTEIDLPIETNAGADTVSVGTANKLGVPYLLKRDTVVSAYRDNTKEGTAPIVETSTTNIEDNTILLNSALNGTNVDVYLIV